MKGTLTPEGTRSFEPQQFRSISLKVHDVSQLFNSMDPSPFLEKDLDDDAEDFIVSWAREFPIDEPLKLRIHLEHWPSENPGGMIEQAVHNHFAHRAELTNLEFRALMKQGRFSLLIGLSSLAFCLALSKALFSAESGTWPSIMREGLTIAGWVAMWRPMEIYLYDWWPLRRRSRIYSKLSHVPVEVLQSRAG